MTLFLHASAEANMIASQVPVRKVALNLITNATAERETNLRTLREFEYCVHASENF